MEKDLGILNNTKVLKKASRGSSCKKIRYAEINGETIILKRFKQSELKKKMYINEKRIYLKLKEEDFLPKLRYFDDKNFILGLTHVGDSLEVFKNEKSEEYYRQVDNINEQIKNIVDVLSNKYGLYHNDLRYRNICIDDSNKIRIIDFDYTGDKLLKREKKYHLSLGGGEMYFKCS